MCVRWPGLGFPPYCPPWRTPGSYKLSSPAGCWWWKWLKQQIPRGTSHLPLGQEIVIFSACTENECVVNSIAMSHKSPSSDFQELEVLKIRQLCKMVVSVNEKCKYIIMCVCLYVVPYLGRGSRRFCTQRPLVFSSRIGWRSWLQCPQPSPPSLPGLALSLRHQLKNNTIQSHQLIKFLS